MPEFDLPEDICTDLGCTVNHVAGRSSYANRVRVHAHHMGSLLAHGETAGRWLYLQAQILCIYLTMDKIVSLPTIMLSSVPFWT